MSGDVTLGFAFLAGLISFISPCVLPLVPAYVGYMGGQLTRQVSGGTAAVAAPSRFRTFTHGLSFVLGFTAFFVIFGLLTTAAISSLEAIGVSDAQVTDAIARIGGTAVILFGLHIMGVLPRVLTWLHRQALQLDRNPYGNLISVVAGIAAIGAIYWLFIESWFMTLVVVLLLAMVFRPALKTDTAGQFWGAIINQAHLALYADTRRQNSLTARYGYSGSFLMGIVFSAGWTPCIGPIYGAVLTQAALGGSIARAGTQLTAYSLGLGIPFLLTALALDQAQGLFRRLQRNMRTVELLSGAFLILIGVLIFSGQLERLTQVGGNQGALADVSINMENCIVGAVQGEVRWRNVIGCISDGPKTEVYFAAKPATLAGASVASGLTQAEPPPESLAAPDLAPPVDESGSPSAAPAADAPVGLRVGDRAPEFVSETVDGQPIALSDFRGQVVLLNFWATWCGPCREEMPDFESIYRQRRDDGLAVLAVNAFESPDQVAAFVDEFDLTFPVILDESGVINSDLYGPAIAGYPTSLLIDRQGMIVRRFPGSLEASVLLDALAALDVG